MHDCPTLRVARPTNDLVRIESLYRAGLGFETLARFEGHSGFDGVILGHPDHPYHLEFTRQRGHAAPMSPSQDLLLVFYLPDAAAWEAACARMESAEFKPVDALNSYWDRRGRTFEDFESYRVVLQNTTWPPEW